jgi:radical SAM protein with 4Fe4S-binding SPASM domain
MQQGHKGWWILEDEDAPFRSHFNRETGEYLRTGLLDENGMDTGEDPFSASFPHLLDVGIMGSCGHGLSGLCKEAGDYCYQSGATKVQDNMTFEDFRRVVDECSGKVFQFALGGRGDPDQHEQFEEFLLYSRQNGIIPNLTTSGYGLTPEKALLIATHCGAVAVSWYRNQYTFQAIEMLLNAGAKVNIHYVLSKDSIDEAIEMLETQSLPEGINRIVFLLFKPVGQGKQQQVLIPDQKTAHFFSLMDSEYGLAKSGFDSCMVPGVLNSTYVVDPDCFDACEAGRYSAYITPDMIMTPCSFDQNGRFGVSLKHSSLQDAWNSQNFIQFRERLSMACPDCTKRNNCFGGCPILPEITLCDDEHRRSDRI